MCEPQTYIIKTTTTFRYRDLNLIGKAIKVRNSLPISLLILSKLINFYSPWNDQKTYGFLMVSSVLELNLLKFKNIRSEIWKLFPIDKCVPFLRQISSLTQEKFFLPTSHNVKCNTQCKYPCNLKLGHESSFDETERPHCPSR